MAFIETWPGPVFLDDLVFMHFDFLASQSLEWWHKFLPHFQPSLRLKPARMKSAFKRGPS